MFTCSNCGHQIDDSRVPLPPFCPRCGEPTSDDASPFDDEMSSPLPPPPPMGAPLPPPPPMGDALSSRPGRGVPSKTLFGMPGLSLDLPDTSSSDDDLPFPSDDDDGDGGLPFPVDDDDDEIAPTPPMVSGPAPGKPPAKPPGIKPPPPAKPPPLGAKPPAAKPPPLGAKPPPLGAKPPPLGAKPPPAAATPPPPPGGKRPVPPPAFGRPAPVRPAPPTEQVPVQPPPPNLDPFGSGDSGIMPGDSGVMSGESGTFDGENPFFSGDPEHMPELGSITQGDARAFANEDPAARSGVRQFELELDTSGPSLELGDLGELGELEPPPPRPQPSYDRGRPDFDNPEFAGLDLPVPNDDGYGALDLPVPSGSANDLDLPAPSSSPARDLDLPAPSSSPARDLDLDLPAPSRATGSKFGADDLDLPAPSGYGADLDLPAPSNFGGGLDVDDGLSLDDLPTAADDLPNLIDDFPAPDSLPTPDLDGFDNLPSSLDNLPSSLDDFPAPVDSLPTPVDSLPTPVDSLPTPVDSLPTPRVDDLELDLDDGPRSGRRAAKPEAEQAATKPDKPGKPGRAPKAAAVKPPSGDKPKRDVSRMVVYGLLGLIVVGVGGGVAAMQMGLFDDDPVIDGNTTNSGDGDQQPTPSTDEPTERPEGVLAKLDQDTPAGYVQAYELSESDPVGRAEAALLLHYRYGPDSARLAEAASLLEPHQSRTEPFVQRVVALALLANGKHDEALARLDGDDPRSSLVRAWALLDKGDFEQARTAAEAVVRVRPNDQAAQLAVLQARYAANPVDGIAAMRQAAKVSPNHLALQEALMAAAVELGRLAEAAELGQSMQTGSIGDAHKAELLRRRAEIAAAQGNIGDALRLLEQALAADPKQVAAAVDRIDLQLRNRDISGARANIELLLRERERDPAVLKAAARVDLESGDDEDARARLAAIGEAAVKDPEAQDLLGQAEAILMKVEQARAAFAEARKLDPFFTPALEHEIALLLRTQQEAAALELLEAERKSLTDANAKDSKRGRAALASVSRMRAEVLRSTGKLEQALTAAEEAIADDGANNRAMLLRAELLGALGRRQAQEEALLELHERTGGFPGLTEPLGQVLLRKQKLDELERLIGTSLDSPDASREILLTGASLRLAQERPEEAETLAQRVLNRDPTDSRAHLLLGRALLARGEYALALDEMESAQTRDGDPEVELWLGQALEYNADPVQARVHYIKALELDRQNLEAAALLGRLYAYDGAAAKAIELLSPVVTATDAYPYAYLALGLAHKDMGKRDLAISDFQKAQSLDPTLFEAFYQEGRIHNDQNKHALAVKALQGGIDNAKQNATERALIDTYRRLGESYAELGRRAEARSALEEYMSLAPSNAAGRREVERLLRDL